MKLRDKLWVNIFISLILVYSLVVCYWLFYPYCPLVESPIKIMNSDKKVPQNGMLVYKIKYDKKMDIHGILTRKLINDFKIEYSDVITTAPIGPDEDQINLPFPDYAPPGKYNLWWSVSYKVNPIRSVHVCVMSEEFEVTKQN